MCNYRQPVNIKVMLNSYTTLHDYDPNSKLGEQLFVRFKVVHYIYMYSMSTLSWSLSKNSHIESMPFNVWSFLFNYTFSSVHDSKF